ncbi:alpha/beta hydrolase [Spirosoma areae]
MFVSGRETAAHWRAIAPSFLTLHYDLFITDYRQHGKSKGAITLANFYSDAQTIYNYLKQRYQEKNIVVVGYSLGGRIAAHVAADNAPKLTLLLDPASAGGDFSDRFTDILFYPLPSVNGFIFPTESAVQKAQAPVVVISTENTHSVAYQLKASLSKKDKFIVIPGASHETMLTHPYTAQCIAELLR